MSTPRRRSSRAVEKGLREVIDGLFAFVGVLAPDGTLVEANRAALEAAQLRPEDALGLPFAETYWWSYSADAQARLRDAVARAARGESCRFDALNRVADGRFVNVDFMLAPLFDERGRVTRLVASGVDITERVRSEEALREGEKRFRATFEQAAVGIAHVGLDGRWLLVNQKLCDIIGYAREELLAKSFQEITHPEDLEADLAQASRLLSGEIQTYSMDKRYARKDGTPVWINLTGSLVRDDATGEPLYFIAVVKDISARKRAEERLRLSEQRFVKAFRASPDVLVISRACDGTILEVNDRWSELFGYTAAEVIGKSSLALDLFDEPADRARVLDALRSQGAVRGFEVKVRRRSGETRDTLLSVELLEDNGEPCILTIVHDITEQKRAEERMRQQAALLDVAQDAILVRDLEDRILYWNRGAERLYGWTAREAVGRQADELLFGEPSPQLREAKRALLRGGEWRGEAHQVTKDGRDVIVESRWTLVRDKRGNPRAKLVVNTDVTEKRRLETELLRASHLSLIGELAAGLAHEIKNPLAGIKGAVDILIRRREPGDAEIEVLEDVRHAVGRIDETVLALLQRARPRPPQFAAASLDEAAHRAVLLARHHVAKDSADARRVTVSFEPSPDPVVLPMDAAQVEDAVLNLILNAVEAVGGDGRVVVSVRRERPRREGEAGAAVIEVSDNGRGIDAADLARVFSPFYTTTEGGTGLGLPSVRRTARAHGGRVEVRSEPGRGSTFAIQLPLPAET